MKLRGLAIDHWILAAIAAGVVVALGAAKAGAATCQKIVLDGEVNAGQAWQAGFGQGWMLRVEPIRPAQAGYSGWDLVVDRDNATGYPDALLLASPPYNSINEREIGTTFGLRAQDAIGWNPRSFHFLIDPAAFREAHQLYLALARDGQLSRSPASPARGSSASRDLSRLLTLVKGKASGEFRIEDARLTPGVADPAPFARAWALAAVHTPHQIEDPPDGKSTPRGSLAWIRFSVTLWLPAAWRLPGELHGVPSACVD